MELKEKFRVYLKGRDMDLTPEEMTGGTFTITNGGTLVPCFQHNLNRPQVQFSACTTLLSAVAVNGQVEIRPYHVLAVTMIIE